MAPSLAALSPVAYAVSCLSSAVMERDTRPDAVDPRAAPPCGLAPGGGAPARTPGASVDARTPSGPGLHVFVYGTLKPGHHNHDLYCQDALLLGPALVRGCLWQRPEGYPTLDVPPDDVLGWASGDLAADLTLRDRLLAAFQAEPEGDLRSCLSPEAILAPRQGTSLVLGKLLHFPDTARAIAALRDLDDLEDFDFGLPSMYCRVLLPVLRLGATSPPCSPSTRDPTPVAALKAVPAVDLCWTYVSPPRARSLTGAA